MNWSETDYRNLLKEEYASRCERNARYSLRAFARDLSLTSARLSEILNGKVGLSTKRAQELAGKLGFSAKETEFFTDLVDARHARSVLKRKIAKSRLSRYRRRPGWTRRSWRASPPIPPAGSPGSSMPLRDPSRARPIDQEIAALVQDPAALASLIRCWGWVMPVGDPSRSAPIRLDQGFTAEDFTRNTLYCDQYSGFCVVTQAWYNRGPAFTIDFYDAHGMSYAGSLGTDRASIRGRLLLDNGAQRRAFDADIDCRIF